MARSCGIRIGTRRYELVVLDGSARKHRIAAFRAGEFPVGVDDPVRAAVHELKDAIKAHRIPLENTSIAIDSGLAAFRTIKLPALDASKLEQVLKFEVEGDLPQWNIDDVVVDSLTLDSTEGEMNVLVTAVPKASLASTLELCSRAGLEPLEAELEATAMVNAALSADICHVDDAQVLVHIGESSTAVVVMDGGKVRAMRAIHIGALTHEPHAEPSGGSENGENGDNGDLDEPAAAPEVDPDELQRRLDQAVSRIRRELGRTLSGARTANPIEAVYVCGWELPDLVGSTVLDIPVYELDVFEEDGGQPAEGTAPLVVAYGVALRQLGGGVIESRLRREELRYTGTFERIELPLAVAALMLVTWLSVFNIFEFQQLKTADHSVFLWLQSSNNFLLGDPKAGARGNLQQPFDALERFIEKTRDRESDLPYSRYEQLQQVKRQLQVAEARLNEDLGNTGEVMQPQSALEGLTLVIDTLRDLGLDRVGRVGVRQARSQYMVGRAGGSDQVQVQLDLSFFAKTSVEATQNFETYMTELRGKPWVKEVESKGSKTFEQGNGIYVDGFTILCDLSKIERRVEEEAGR